MARPKKVIILGDCHAPWIEQRTVDRFLDHLRSEHFDVCLQMGDLYDLYSQSRWARTHDLCTPSEELKAGREWAENFWSSVKKIQKNIKCIQLKGNHDDRAHKRMLEKVPELAPFCDFESSWRFKGVITIQDSRQELYLDDVVYQHGHRGKLGDHARFNLQKTVVGHSHKGGTVFFPHRDQMIWELNVGFCASTEAVPMRYSPQTIHKMTQGYGIVDILGPRFIPIDK